MIRKFYLLIFTLAATGLFQTARSQVIIKFDEKGRMTSAPPNLLTDESPLTFAIQVSQKFYNDRLLDWYQRYRQNLRLLDDVKDKPWLYGLPEDDAGFSANKNVINGVQKSMANELVSLLNDADDAKVLALQMNVTSEKSDLAVYTGLASPIDLNIPKIKALILPRYNLQITATTLSNFTVPGDYANQPLPFLPAKNADKSYTYTLNIKANHLKAGPVKYSYQVILQNNVYTELNNQLMANVSLSAYIQTNFTKKKINELQQAVDNHIKTAILAIPDGDKVLNWLVKKENGDVISPAEQTASDLVTNVPARLTALNGAILASTSADLALGKNIQSVKWLIQFAWLINPQALTANPFSVPNPFQAQLKALNTSLANANLDLTRLTQEASLLENRSKVQGTGVTENQDLLATYSNKLKEKQTKQQDITKLQSSIDDMKKSSADLGKSQAAIKGMILSDSLLYDGQMLMNLANSKTNLDDYAYMRHHDAANDFQLMGNEVTKQVNEKQRMYVLVENMTKPTGFILTTTITPIALKDDSDLPGGELKQFFGAEGSAEELYKNYVQAKRLYNAYSNGLMLQPVPPVNDLTPNYATRPVSHEMPSTAPSLITYQIIDTTTTKNANSEKTVYQYRMNKLYRYRIKAGMVYSFLERRDYTIDAATNTATYVADRGGLGVAVGVQVFPYRLDIQNPKFLPQPVPFIYIGYQITDAPANNLLVGLGWEIFSGVAVHGGVHFGKAERLTVNNGILSKTGFYDHNGFIGLSIGLEAFDALFNKAKPTNPFKQ